jgi:hypothetical protein
MQGVNLAGSLTHSSGRWPDSVYAEGGIGQPNERRMVVRGRHKLVVDSALRPIHLYNLHRDPYELENLASKSSKRAICDPLKAMLLRWATRTGDPIA